MSTSNSRNYHPGSPRRVALSRDGKRWSLTFVREFPQAPAALWSALTDPAELPHWAPYTANSDLGTVGPATLIMTDGDERTEVDGRVLRADQPTRADLPTRADGPTLLEHAWGDDVLRWDLLETGSGTLLTLRHTLDDKNTAAMMAAGWHMCLDVAEGYLAGNGIGPIVGSDALNYGWSDLNRQYAAKLGVKAI